jgi:DNA repair exonuclease SbcCD ATPase subunit
MRSSLSRQFKTVNDLLGASYVWDYDKYAEQDFHGDQSRKQNDLKEKFIMNNLQALENLTKSANEKSEKLNSLITEILNKRLESLEQNLTNTHKQKLNTMESDLREIIKKKNYLQISITAILTAVITIALLWTVSGKQYNEQTKETFYYIKTKG